MILHTHNKEKALNVHIKISNYCRHTHRRVKKKREKYLRLNHALQIKITILLRQCRSLFLCVSIRAFDALLLQNRHCRRAMMIVNNIIEEIPWEQSGKRRLKKSQKENLVIYSSIDCLAAAVAFFWYSSENSLDYILLYIKGRKTEASWVR